MFGRRQNPTPPSSYRDADALCDITWGSVCRSERIGLDSLSSLSGRLLLRQNRTRRGQKFWWTKACEIKAEESRLHSAFKQGQILCSATNNPYVSEAGLSLCGDTNRLAHAETIKCVFSSGGPHSELFKGGGRQKDGRRDGWALAVYTAAVTALNYRRMSVLKHLC